MFNGLRWKLSLITVMLQVGGLQGPNWQRYGKYIALMLERLRDVVAMGEHCDLSPQNGGNGTYSRA